MNCAIFSVCNQFFCSNIACTQHSRIHNYLTTCIHIDSALIVLNWQRQTATDVSRDRTTQKSIFGDFSLSLARYLYVHIYKYSFIPVLLFCAILQHFKFPTIYFRKSILTKSFQNIKIIISSNLNLCTCFE